MSDNQSNLRKKILYQSQNRGCKETDLILGNFAEKYLEQMDIKELENFQRILELSDADIYDWYNNKAPVPAEYNTPLMQKLLNFMPVK